MDGCDGMILPWTNEIKVTLDGIVSASGQSNPYFKGVHDRSVMVSMKAYLHTKRTFQARIAMSKTAIRLF